MELVVNFTLNNEELNADFDISEIDNFDAVFQIDAAGTTWGSIDGTLSNQTDLQSALNLKANQSNLDATNETVAQNYNTLDDKISDNTQDISDINTTISGYGNIVTHNTNEFATFNQGSKADTALQPNDNISELTNDVGYITSSALPTVNNAILTIQKNSNDVGIFTANASVDKIINISVPVNANDVNALPNSTKYGASIDVVLNTTDYKLTISLKDQDGTVLNSKMVDFPIESVVVNGSYDSVNQKIILTLQNGNTIDIPVGALISGLQTEITSSNKLDADLVDDNTSINKFVTASDKTTWNNKQDAISDLSTIRSNATNGQSAYTTISGYGNIVTHNTSEFATSAQGTLADTALQPNDNISELANDAGYITSASLPTVNDGTLNIQVNGTSIGTFTANQSSNTTANIVVPDSATWGNITGTLSNQTDLQTALNAKQNILVSGTNIKTLSNLSLLGNGDIPVNGGTDITVTTGSGDRYTTLDYIQSSGTQYINSGVIPASFDYEIETVFAFDEVNSSNTPLCAWGYMGNGTYPRWLLGSYQSKYLLNVNATSAFGTQDTLKHTFNGKAYLNSGNAPRWNCSIDGTVILDDQVLASDSSFLSNTMPIYMFARNNSGTAGNFVSGKLYKHTVKKAGVKIQELIPVKRNSDDAIGLYDTVTDTFFGNAGTGTFTAGSATGTIGEADGITISFNNNTGYITGINWGDIGGTLSSQTDLQNALNNADEIFEVTYGTTTFAEISTALSNGKTPVCQYDNKIYVYSLISGTVHYLTAVYAPYIYVLRCHQGSPYWSSLAYALEQTANKVTTISSASTDAQYPSAKCVYDNLELKANISSLATVAFTGTYADLVGTPTIGDGITTITQNGTPVGTITANQTSSNTIDIQGTTYSAGVGIDITSNTITAKGVEDVRTSNAVKTWTGTKVQYDAIVTKDANTIYNITDDTDVTLTLLDALYPVGAIYIGTMANCPLQVLGVGTWTLKTANAIVTGVNATAPVKGNGMTLGLTNGTDYTGLGNYASSNAYLSQRKILYGESVGTNFPSSGDMVYQSLGVTTDETKSGIEATVTSTSLTVNIWERTA